MGTLIASSQKDSLNLTSPELIQSIHRQYLDAGADILKTNTFNSNRGRKTTCLILPEPDWRAQSRMNTPPQIPLQPRYVAGAMGPGRDGLLRLMAYFEQARGLMEGGVDMLLAETITSIRTAQSAMAAIEKLFERMGREIPVLLSVTISRDGSLISGESLQTFWNAVSTYTPYAVGINCGFGARHSAPIPGAIVENGDYKGELSSQCGPAECNPVATTKLRRNSRPYWVNSRSGVR